LHLIVRLRKQGYRVTRVLELQENRKIAASDSNALNTESANASNGIIEFDRGAHTQTQRYYHIQYHDHRTAYSRLHPEQNPQNILNWLADQPVDAALLKASMNELGTHHYHQSQLSNKIMECLTATQGILAEGFLSPDQGEFFSTAERTETIHPVHFSYDVGFRVNQF